MAGPLTLETLIRFLMDAPMFGDLDEHELSEVVHIMQVQHMRPGQVLFEQGAQGDAWFVVYEGEVQVLVDTGQGQDVIRRLGARSCFGEMAVLDGSPRSATAIAASACTVLRFPRAAFQLLLDADNLAAYKLVMQMALVLVARQRDATDRLVMLLRDNQDALVREGLEPIVEASLPSE